MGYFVTRKTMYDRLSIFAPDMHLSIFVFSKARENTHKHLNICEKKRKSTNEQCLQIMFTTPQSTCVRYQCQ